MFILVCLKIDQLVPILKWARARTHRTRAHTHTLTRTHAHTHTHTVLTTDACLILEDYKPQTSESYKIFLRGLRSFRYERFIRKHCH